MSLQDLNREDRLRLVRFVCSFAWADLEVVDSERDLVHELVGQLELDDDEKLQVEKWLDHPPRAEELDPQEIPLEHRQIFLDAMLGLLGADGEIDEAETESFNLLSQLLR